MQLMHNSKSEIKTDLTGWALKIAVVKLLLLSCPDIAGHIYSRIYMTHDNLGLEM